MPQDDELRKALLAGMAARSTMSYEEVAREYDMAVRADILSMWRACIGVGLTPVLEKPAMPQKPSFEARIVQGPSAYPVIHYRVSTANERQDAIFYRMFHDPDPRRRKRATRMWSCLMRLGVTND